MEKKINNTQIIIKITLFQSLQFLQILQIKKTYSNSPKQVTDCQNNSKSIYWQL